MERNTRWMSVYTRDILTILLSRPFADLFASGTTTVNNEIDAIPLHVSALNEVNTDGSRRSFVVSNRIRETGEVDFLSSSHIAELQRQRDDAICDDAIELNGNCAVVHGKNETRRVTGNVSWFFDVFSNRILLLVEINWNVVKLKNCYTKLNREV